LFFCDFEKGVKMPGQRKLDNDNEKAAIRYKQKHQRTLEKSMKTLDLEKTYSLKLLDLDHRIVRVNYKHLKDKVSRIRSNLSAHEITHLKDLEASGRMKSYSNTMNLSSALKIAAAAKRLKLQTPQKRAATALPAYTLNTPSSDSKASTPRSEPQPVNLLRRSNSVTGVFIDTPAGNATKRRSSVDGTVQNRPLSAMPGTSNLERTKVSKRPMTSHVSRVPQTPRSPVHAMPTHSPYSSHSAVEKAQSGIPPQSREKTSLLSDDIDSNLGEDLYEERRQEYLLTEEIKREELEDKRTDFLKRLGKYLAANPTRDWSSVSTNFTFPDSTETREEGEDEVQDIEVMKPKRKLLPGRSRPNMATSLTNESLYKQKMLELWKDLNKCRYLRLPDERIDLSGVETLAKNQVKLYEMLQNREESVK